MHKISIRIAAAMAVAAAALTLGTAAQAQPAPHREPAPHMKPHHAPKKVWVPAHREHGRLVRGHYVRR